MGFNAAFMFQFFEVTPLYLGTDDISIGVPNTIRERLLK